MVSDLSSRSNSSTTPLSSLPRFHALYVPSPEHRWAPGIPARDLSPDEVEQYGLDLLKNAQCYEFVPVEDFIEEE